jgi:fumarate hydratase subunit alpha
VREINAKEITQAVRLLCMDANMRLSDDVENALKSAVLIEKSEIGRGVLADLVLNLDAARELNVPICQDTGMQVIFMDIGQDIHIIGGSLETAANEGVRLGTEQGKLRCSVVADPLERVNTGNNTPCILHVRIVDGEKLKITVSPKGFGSENMSALKMFTPSATRDDIIAFVVDCVTKAGSNPCPPVIVGVGIGGNFEYAAYLAKKALCRPVDQRNAKTLYSSLESDLLLKINQTGIGPQGFGGTVTALAVNVETFATHIAGLPVAVNMGCHVTRHKSIVL